MRADNGRRRVSLIWVLGPVVGLLTVVPFLPLVALSWANYRDDLGRVEREIQESNRHIAMLAATFLDTFLVQVRREAELTERASPPALPPPADGVRWELVDGGGVVRLSALAAPRVGRPSGYGDFLDAVEAGDQRLSMVRKWVPELPPTAALARRLEGGGWLVALVDPEALHRRLLAWSGHGVDRHLYTVDGGGNLIFYSDLTLSERGVDLRDNPPIGYFLAGGRGELRYVSVVSGKPRLGYVEALDESDWAVVVSADAGTLVLALKDRYSALALSILFAVAAAVAILLWTSRFLGGPLLDIVRALRDPERSTHHPLAVRDASRRIAEMDEVVHAFDELSAEVAAIEKELVEAEKAALLGRLASGLAHEMGTPLNVISGNAEYLLRKTAEGDSAREVLRLVIDQSERIAEMIRRLLDLSRPAPARLEELHAGEVVNQSLRMLPGIARNIEVVTTIEDRLPLVMADPKLLEHALLNLLVNAIQAMPDGGRLTVVVRTLPPADDAHAAGGWLTIEIQDTGVGIPAEDLDRIFEPFFTTKAQGKGTGLGLAIVERIVRQHGGEIRVASRLGHGAVFTLRLRTATTGNAGIAARRHHGR